MTGWPRRLALLLVGLGWLALAHPQAQTAPTLEWQHDGLNVTEFKCQIDSGTLASLGLPTPSGTTYSAALSTCGTIEKGQHLLYVYACNAAGCTVATAIYVVKLEPDPEFALEWER
jgi:hypothetical protein